MVDMNRILLYLPPEKQSTNVKKHLESEVRKAFLLMIKDTKELLGRILHSALRGF